MSPPRVRLANEGDVEAIAGILHAAEAWLRERGMPMWAPDELEVEPLRRDVRAGLHYVAEVEGEIAGTVRFQLEDLEYWPEMAGTSDSAYVHRLAVDRRFAGSGMASLLLEWAAARAARLGRRYLRLDCDWDRPRLRAFYERNGFRHHSDRQVGRFFVARYERELQPGSST